MQRELEMWKAETKQQGASWGEQQRQTEEALQPLYSQLHDLEDSINDCIMKVWGSGLEPTVGTTNLNSICLWPLDTPAELILGGGPFVVDMGRHAVPFHPGD